MPAQTRRISALAIVVGGILTCLLTGSVQAGPTGGALHPEVIRVLDVTGPHGAADDATMVAVNITATRGAEKGYLTAYPCDQDAPETSNVNYLADQIVPAFALVRIGGDDTICITTSAIADLVVDLVGYVASDSNITPLPRPFRALDTRRTRTPDADETLRVPIEDIEGTEPGADLVMANVTAIARGGTGYVTTHPCASTVPNTSSVNYGPGQTNANFVISRLDDTGAICVTTSEPADIIVDVAATAADAITTLPTPIRIVDTRTTGTRKANSTLTVDVDAQPAVTDTATAAVYNLTAANAGATGYATSHPCLPEPPNTSNLNYAPGAARANGTITKLSWTGQFCITTSADVDLIVDLIGYTTDTTQYVPITPLRIDDSREGWAPTCNRLVGTRASSPMTSEQPLTMLDLDTGQQWEVPNPPLLVGSAVAIDGDCDHLLYFSRAAGIERVDIHTGAREQLAAVSEARFQRLDDGTVAAWVDGGTPEVYTELIDLDTGQWILRFDEETGPPSGTNLHFDASLSWMAFQSNDGFQIWDLAADTLELLDPRGGQYEMSPDGTYVSRGFVRGNHQWCEIMTRIGDTVDEIDLGPTRAETEPCRWASPGTLFVRLDEMANPTQGGSTIVRFDLFGSPKVIAQPEQVSRFERRWLVPIDYR